MSVIVRIKLENDYGDGHRSESQQELEGPAGLSDAELDEWWEDVVFPLTGDGHGINCGAMACYSATVVEADDTTLVGLTREWV